MSPPLCRYLVSVSWQWKEGRKFCFLRESGFCRPKCGPWTSSIRITWKFFRRAELWAQTSRISELMLTSVLVPSVCVCVCALSCLFVSPLYNPMDSSLPGSSVHGIFQARILEWVAISFSRGSSQPRNRTHVSHIAGGFFAIWPTREAQEYWSGLPFPSPGDLT